MTEKPSETSYESCYSEWVFNDEQEGCVWDAELDDCKSVEVCEEIVNEYTAYTMND